MSRPSRPYRPRPPSAYSPSAAPSFVSHASRPSLSRSSYPSFLSLYETARVQLACAAQGLLDAFRWDIVVRLVASDAEIRANVSKSMLLNSISLASIYVFELLLFPLARDQRKWLHRNVGWAYQVLWLLPVVGVSLYLNSTFCTLIAKRTFVLQHGSRAAAAAAATYTGMLNALATSAYGAIMVVTSLVVSFALGYIPVLGPWLGFTFACWVDAYYCFDFVWIARGLSLSRRIRHLEERWAYYFAFGLPIAALCMWGGSLANAALFALLWPSFIIMAMHARPVPLDPFNPAWPRAHGEQEAEIRHPSPFVPIRLPIFAPVLWLNDGIARALSVGGGAGARHRRVSSDSAESVEEGAAVQMGMVGGAPVGSVRTRTRVGSGAYAPSRRKFD
ncbi:etoposide-induced protein 2.4-domain-containing protein [Sparassis latifolia]|uniref:Protein EI24 homolog n=1 Tax=Sparassis crispa TaxID=139825 RepID=A0A401GKB8_9APHY|nr:hypothetical protein SCP_0409980 [Sparassis crispa]GBE82613.1 hypothetical protein SCP_0409980 [Sparassis crispa]